MLNASGKSGDTCTAPYLKGKAFSLSPLSLYIVILFDFKYILSETSISFPALSVLFTWNFCFPSFYFQPVCIFLSKVNFL